MRLPDRTLAVLACALTGMFVVVPPTVAGGSYGHGVFDNSRLVDVTGTSLVDFWASGSGTPPPALQAAVDHWARYHAALAAMALVAAAGLTVVALRAWRAARPRPHARRTLRAFAVAGTALAAAMFVLAAANVSNAVAPEDGLRRFFSAPSSPAHAGLRSAARSSVVAAVGLPAPSTPNREP